MKLAGFALLASTLVVGCASTPIDGTVPDYTGGEFARQQHEHQAREMAEQQRFIKKQQDDRIRAEKRRQKEILEGQYEQPTKPPEPHHPRPPRPKPADPEFPEPKTTS